MSIYTYTSNDYAFKGIFWDMIFEDHPAITFEKILIFTLLIFTLS